MAKPYRSKEADAAPMQGQCHAAMSNTALQLNDLKEKINLTSMRQTGRPGDHAPEK